MGYEYDDYLREHKKNVVKGYNWIRDNLPELIDGKIGIGQLICYDHDKSKSSRDEYEAYDAYFYGGNRSASVVQAFNKAWLTHIHRNPHHWQHWILVNDDPYQGEIILEMPYNYVVEMICDWWSFGWKSENLYEIFDWWKKREEFYIKLHPNTRKLVERILKLIKVKLDEPAKGES